MRQHHSGARKGNLTGNRNKGRAIDRSKMSQRSRSRAMRKNLNKIKKTERKGKPRKANRKRNEEEQKRLKRRKSNRKQR
jgi:hypothetical protein